MAAKPVTFFLDNTFAGHKIPRGLRRAKLNVERLRDVFQRDDVADAEWIPFVSQPPYEWVGVTKDHGILLNPHEFAAICDARARLILYPCGEDLSADEVVERFLRHLPAITQVLDTRRAPFLVLLYADRVEVFPPEDVFGPPAGGASADPPAATGPSPADPSVPPSGQAPAVPSEPT